MTSPAVPETSGTILERPVERPVEHGDHERFSHYAERDKITEAMVLGTPIKALCGKIWVPSRDPSRFPVCPECKEIFEDDNRFYDQKPESGE
ncbi:DUF3039 domain-containing protein [Plantactinospora sp. KBS50]|uniref:DUF3039 domain-containing protein n=1 Tax=Plantactinospora sp. KBS50 TaxID=2024580 RepID=UPI001E37B797|nr:DUF3039 domain-containing protein [Plantactinospora sp. KBS50]